MGNQRFRLRFTFWLDIEKKDEYELAEQIDELKQQRRFSQTIRDGIWLICDLREGRTDRLFAMFPWLKTDVLSTNGAEPERSLQQEIQSLRQLLLMQQGATSRYDDIVAADDADIELDIKAVSDGASTNNFLNSIMGLQH